MTLVKICGIRTIEAAVAALDAGADFLGFNFVPTSKRYIDPKDAEKIIEEIEISGVELVGVFQNEEFGKVNKIAASLGLDYVQLHGEEDNEYISKIDFPVIKSITLNDNPRLINAEYFLLDRKGRTGDIVDLEKAAEMAKKFQIFFAGGLTPENVSEIVVKVQPFAVDVAGGIETDGVQDLDKIKLFIENAKEVNIWKAILENMGEDMSRKC